jgi:hypothetical protein
MSLFSATPPLTCCHLAQRLGIVIPGNWTQLAHLVPDTLTKDEEIALYLKNNTLLLF